MLLVAGAICWDRQRKRDKRGEYVSKGLGSDSHSSLVSGDYAGSATMDSTENERGPEPTRIVVADDHPLVRESLRQMLHGPSDLEVVAEASDGLEVVEL